MHISMLMPNYFVFLFLLNKNRSFALRVYAKSMAVRFCFALDPVFNARAVRTTNWSIGSAHSALVLPDWYCLVFVVVLRHSNSISVHGSDMMYEKEKALAYTFTDSSGL